VNFTNRCKRDSSFIQWLESSVAEFYLLATCKIREDNLVFSKTRSLIFFGGGGGGVDLNTEIFMPVQIRNLA